jgi:hypothetical protein
MKNLCEVAEATYSDPFTVIPVPQSRGGNLALPVQGKLREESRSENKGRARFLVACGCNALSTGWIPVG